MFKKLLAGMFQPELDALRAEGEQKLAAQAKEHAQALEALRQQAAQASRERDALQALPAQLAEAQSAQQSLQSQLNAQAAQLGDQQAQSTQVSGLEAALEDLRTQLAAEQQARQGAETWTTQLESELAALRAQLAELKTALEAAEGERTRLQLRAQLAASAPPPTASVPSPPATAPQVGKQAGNGADSGPLGHDANAVIRPPARNRKKVLIVDDAATTRMLQKNMLESAGYEVVMGNDGEQGQTMIPEHLPDLVITDIEMPRMNGFELTTWIKQSPYREVPVLMVTSHSDDAFQQKGLQAGANGFVEKKSFNQKTFLEIIQQYV